MSEIITNAELSRRAGVSKGAITKAITRGLLEATPDKKIDTANPKTIEYLKNHNGTPGVKQDHRDRVKRQSRKGPDPEGENRPDKYIAEVRKLEEMIEKLKISNAKELRKLIPIAEVQRLFEKQNAIIVSHFHPVGQRTSEKIAGVLGTTDNAIMLKIAKIITDEVMIGVDEYKKALIITE